MTPPQIESLKEDFLEWTGGFEPESEGDIETYISSSMSAEFEDREPRRVLTDWLRNVRSVDVR